MKKNWKNNKIKWFSISIVASCFLVIASLLGNYRDNNLITNENITNNIYDDAIQAKSINQNEKILERQESLSTVQTLHQNTNKSKSFKEIYFAKTQDGEKFFSLIYERNNLWFRTPGSSTLLESASLTERKTSVNEINTLNGVAFNSNILSIDRISVTPDGNSSNKTTVINSNFDTAIEAPTFIQNGTRSYFKAGTNNNINLNISNSNTYLVRFYLSGAGSSSLSMFYDDGNGNIIDKDSSFSERSTVNMLSNESSIAIEGWVTKNANDVSFSFATPNGGNNNVILGSSNPSIFNPLRTKRADQALSEIELGNPAAPSGMTWAEYFRGLILNGFNEAQIIFSSFKATADVLNGEINVEIYNPISTQTATPTTSLQHYIYLSGSPPPLQFGNISGFNTGTVLLKTDFETSVAAIPEFAMDNNTYLLNIYKMIFDDGFGPNNLLNTFDYRLDMKLDKVVVDNLNGTLNADLIILNNYRTPSGDPITNNIPKNFGKIFITNFSKIKSTQVLASSLNLPFDSPLVSEIPSEAIKNEASLIEVIYNGRNSLLNNLPDDTNTIRNVLISDFKISVIGANNARGTITLNVSLGYYFDQDFGIYKNQTPLVFPLTIEGFTQTRETVVDTSKTYVLENTNNIYPQNYVNNSNINSIIQNYIFDNTNDKLFIIENAPLKGTPNGFNTSDILIKAIVPLNLRAEVEVSFTILKWYDQSGALVNSPFPTDSKIIFSSFKKAEVTYINTHNANKPFFFDNRDLSPTEFLAIGDSENRIKQFILDNAFNISTQNIIVGTLPADNFNLSNINLISTKPLDLQGQLEISFAINSYIENTGDIIVNGNFDLQSPLIKIAGFSVVKETQLLNNRFLVPDSEQNKPAVTFSIEKAKQFLIDLLLNNRLLNSYPVSVLNPQTDLEIRDFRTDNIAGEVYLNLFVKNYYDANGKIVSNFKLMGHITIYGFNKLKVTAIENGRTFSIANNPIFNQKYVDQLNDDDIKEMIKIFAIKNQLIINVPDNFDYDTNILDITRDPKKETSTIVVSFSIDYYYNDKGIATSNPKLRGQVSFSGFLIPPVTKLNDQVYNFNSVEHFRIKSINDESLNAIQIYEKIVSSPNDSAFQDIMFNGTGIGNKPIIKIDNPKNLQEKLNIVYNENSLRVNSDGTLFFSGTFTGGFYNFDSIPIGISNPNLIRTFTIYDLGILADTSALAPTTIGLIVAGSIVGLVTMFIVTYLIRKKMVAKSSHGDRYDDEDPDNKISF